MLFEHEAWVLVLALFALYSPIAALSSYLPIVRPYSHPTAEPGHGWSSTCPSCSPSGSVAAAAYAVVTGLTLYASGHVERRISLQAWPDPGPVAGILLTSIAVILLANGFTDLLVAALGR